VPYYRELWARRRREGDRRSWDYLENWPVLEKEALRQNPHAFLADDRPRLMYSTATSGTTGKPLRLWQSRRTLVMWYAMMEARWRRWYGISRDDRWAILGGQVVTPVDQKRPPYWVWNMALRQLYLSSYHLSAATVPYYADALAKYRVSYLWGYPSALYALAREVLRHGRTDVRQKVVIANAEPLYDSQREVIAEAFQCPVRETYGMSEMVTAASECESGSLHLWPRVGVTEVWDGNGPLPPGAVGDLICTGLLNTDMPLIRYRIGDRAALAPANGLCPCGRTLPMMRSIEGRNDDMLYTADGRLIGRLDPVFKRDLPIEEAQIVQKALDLLVVRYVPAAGFDAAAARAITNRLRERMGDIRVDLERVDRIERGPTGKFRAVVCELKRGEVAHAS
jgi:phenylacetate-CoA ligase